MDAKSHGRTQADRRKRHAFVVVVVVVVFWYLYMVQSCQITLLIWLLTNDSHLMVARLPPYSQRPQPHFGPVHGFESDIRFKAGFTLLWVDINILEYANWRILYIVCFTWFSEPSLSSICLWKASRALSEQVITSTTTVENTVLSLWWWWFFMTRLMTEKALKMVWCIKCKGCASQQYNLSECRKIITYFQ